MNYKIVESFQGKKSVVQILINSRTKIWDVTQNETMLQSTIIITRIKNRLLFKYNFLNVEVLHYILAWGQCDEHRNKKESQGLLLICSCLSILF